MKDRFIIVEAGSTLTKSYLFEDGEIKELPFEFIEFKKHYSIEKRVLLDDEMKLFGYINRLKVICSDIHIYGTSIFRIISEEEKEHFVRELQDETGMSFSIVSPDEEEKYTVDGIVANIEYQGNIAIVVSGGGSTECAIVNNGTIIEKVELDIGGVDITNLYPGLADDIASVDIDEVVEYIMPKLSMLTSKADLLITGGGATKYFREKALYHFITDVPFKYNKDEFVIIGNDYYEQDKNYFYKTSLADMKKHMPETPNWWNPTRAINCFVEAVARTVGAKYIAASNINMIYGIVEDLKQGK